jgi:hypothetical protein
MALVSKGASPNSQKGPETSERGEYPPRYENITRTIVNRPHWGLS